METRPFIEPAISENYLCSSSGFDFMLRRIVDSPNSSLKVKPNSLDPTPYFLRIASRIQDNVTGDISVIMEIINDQGKLINGRRCGAVFGYNPRDRRLISVTGEFHNDSHRPSVLMDTPIRNVSGVIAPLEDALCQAIANKMKVTARRQVYTNQVTGSRFVRNYEARGYMKANLGPTTTLTKFFEPVSRV